MADPMAKRLVEHAVLQLHLRALEQLLCQEPLLPRLAAAQAAADAAGIARAYHAYQQLLRACGGAEETVQQLVDSHARRLCAAEGERPVAPSERPSHPHAGGPARAGSGASSRGEQRVETALEQEVALLHDWLLSLTLRDCSVMVCLQMLPPDAAARASAAPGACASQQRPRARRAQAHDEGEARTVRIRLDDPARTELAFAYSIGVVDLDPKPVGKVLKHMQEAQAGVALARAIGIAASLAGGGEARTPLLPAEVSAMRARARQCEGLRGQTQYWHNSQ
jgi:hypothetical protein